MEVRRESECALNDLRNSATFTCSLRIFYRTSTSVRKWPCRTPFALTHLRYRLGVIDCEAVGMGIGPVAPKASLF